MKLKLDKTNYTIAKFRPDFPVPTWFQTDHSQFKSITYTAEECSIIMPTESLDTAESDWFLLKIEGILDFSLTGILHKIATPLAEKEISIFAVSTYNTDYILMKQANLDLAITTLTTAGHQITE
ncbi:ACT domain-containing protein [Listeria sp. FSL L7-1582]|uniref:ACT domain-containing protein n=1 Tax=Listeria portnoyi TaxID=2713504 RepID=UPI00164E6883|nr:ACT domain-containing protein [Listeria portnoyi]MBC6308584.1 ACT domain-containing protein [Listeria portnoyi]